MERFKMILGVIAGLALLLTAAPHGSAAIITYQQGVSGYASAGDTYLLGDNRIGGGTPNGSDTTLAIYEREIELNNSSRALLRFDNLGHSGQGSQIYAASLTVYFSDSVNQGGSTDTWSLYALTSANAAWNPATATWNKLNQSTPVAWAGGNPAGAFGGESLVAGTDYDATPIASITVDNSIIFGEALVFNFNAAGIATLADWMDNPADNAGFLLRDDSAQADSGARNDHIFSDDTSIATDRPLLTIALPEPASLGLIVLGGTVLLRRRRA